MSVPNHSVVPITKDDVPIIGGYLQASKLQLSINRFLINDWPNFPLQNAHYTSVIASSLANPQMTCLKIVNDTSQQPVAHLFYTRKSSRSMGRDRLSTEESGGEGSRKVPVGFVPDVYQTVMDFAQELQPEFDTEEFIELTHLYVEPSSRGQGMGSWLLQIARQAATDAKLPFTLCSEPTHHDFFVSRGLRDVKTVDVDLRKWAASLSGYGIFRMSRMQSTE
ncbi:hypothetical protein GQX73_g2032 [Xylaria multiplex]|uniref:N-acetyltransferase domain-containing protein n=1 Tax=Xylaria multiplex TaxID=323545 RepID=A0A7C8N2L3_9PEZI|nr:hypothetical protein GQX73_g2032 [Xylaria multiplex]